MHLPANRFAANVFFADQRCVWGETHLAVGSERSEAIPLSLRKAFASDLVGTWLTVPSVLQIPPLIALRTRAPGTFCLGRRVFRLVRPTSVRSAKKAIDPHLGLEPRLGRTNTSKTSIVWRKHCGDCIRRSFFCALGARADTADQPLEFSPRRPQARATPVHSRPKPCWAERTRKNVWPTGGER